MFDKKKFKAAKLKPRTLDVHVPSLSDFFDKGKAIWTIKGLTGQEIGYTKEAAAKNKNLTAIVDAIAGSQKEKVQGIKDALGIGKIPDDIAQRVAQLEMGSVNPKCDTDMAVRLCEHFPVEFYNLTNEILKLTGQGSEPGKPKGSTQTPESEPV